MGWYEVRHRHRSPAARAIVLVVLSFTLAGCATSIRRDHLLEPKPEGTRLTGLGFLGPGGRVTLDNRVDIAPGESQLRTQVRADANFGYADASVHADIQLMVLFLGLSGGYRYGWHFLEFQPDENGLDNGQPELNRKARIAKDEEDDFGAAHWPWAEGRARLALPFGPVTALTTANFRFEDRRDNSFSWEYATVYDKGFLVNWETVIFLRHRHVGFIGPMVRLLNMPRGDDRENEFQYGIAGGTTPGWSEAEHALVLRVLTNAGFDDQFMGAHFYRIPIHLILGYQQDFDL